MSNLSNKEISIELAKEYIVNHKYDYITLNKNYGGGFSANQVDFAYQFLAECSHEVINALKASPNPQNDFKNTVKHFVQPLLAFNDSEFAYGLDYLKQQLANNFPEFSEGSNLKPEIKKAILEMIGENENSNPSKNKTASIVTEIEVTKKNPTIK